MSKTIPLLVVSLLLMGCAKTVPLVIGPDHPASVDAPTSPVPPLSATLALSKSVASVPSSHNGSNATGHEGHDMGHTSHAAGSDGQKPSSQPATSQPTASATYVCLHHPEVISDQPGKCPQCKMKLVKKEAR